MSGREIGLLLILKMGVLTWKQTTLSLLCYVWLNVISSISDCQKSKGRPIFVVVVMDLLNNAIQWKHQMAPYQLNG